MQGSNETYVFGFWGGVFYGIFLPLNSLFKFIFGLFGFGKYIELWASHNNGWNYTLGFILGVGSHIGGFILDSIKK